MTKNRIKAYWLLLLILMTTALLVLSPGETQARYANTVFWNTLVENDNDLVSSNLLRNVSEPPVTILLGELGEDGVEIPITLTSEINAEGVLAWSRSGAPETSEPEPVGEETGETIPEETTPAEAAETEPAETEPISDPLDPDYLVHVEMTSQNAEEDKDFIHENNQFIKLTAGETVTVMMKLEPGLLAVTELKEATDVYVTVSWGNTLTAKFKVTLPPAEGLPEETEPETTEPEATDPEATEPSVPETTEPEATEPSVPETTEPAATETTEPSVPETTEPEETEPGTTGSQSAMRDKLADILGLRPETNEDESEAAPPTEPAVAAGEEGEEPTEATEPPVETPVPPVIPVDAVARMTLSEELALQIGVPEEITAIQIGMGLEIPGNADGDVPQMVYAPLPEYTCYSLDQGQSYFMFYYPGMIRLETTPGETVTVMMDFSSTQMDTEELILTFMGWRENEMWGTGIAVVAVDKDRAVTLSSRYLEPETPLVIEIPDEWEGYTMTYRIEKLTCSWSQDGKTCDVYYESVNPEEAGIIVTVDTSAGTLTMETDTVLPDAGTYRIVMSWSSEDINTRQVQETFFINYLAYSEVLETGGAEQ